MGFHDNAKTVPKLINQNKNLRYYFISERIFKKFIIINLVFIIPNSVTWFGRRFETRSQDPLEKPRNIQTHIPVFK